MSITRRQYQKFFMPSTSTLPKEEQTWVVFDTSPSRASDSFMILDTDNPSVRLCKFIVGRISEWNYKDEDGSIAEVNWQNLGDIPQADLNYLGTIKLENPAAVEVTDAEKKS